MKFIIDIPESLGKKIFGVIEKHKYPDISTFFVISAENQLLLEGSEEGILDKDKLNHLLGYGKNQQRKKTQKASLDVTLHMNGLDFDLLSGLALEPPSFEQVNWSGAEKEEDLWLWGQYNRILPVKVAARLLAIAENKANKLLLFPEWRKEAAVYARQVGMNILQQDELLGHRRDEKLSTAFPVGKEKE